MFFFQAEDGIRDLVRSRGLGDVYKRQRLHKHANSGADLLAFFADRLKVYLRDKGARHDLILSLIHI